MKQSSPVDPRLVRISQPTRRWIIRLAGLTAAQSLFTIIIGVLIGVIVAGIISKPENTLETYSVELLLLILAIFLRGVTSWIQTRYSDRAAATVIMDLRKRTLNALAYSDPRHVDHAAWRTTLGTGLEGLGPYLTGYLPALAATAISTPLALGVVWFFDVGSMVIALITLPLIPVFMWLVGTLTAGKTEQRLKDLGALADQMLDLIAGLPTLRFFHRHQEMAEEVRRLSNQHRKSTLGVLQIAFLSSFVLEFLATLSVALVAVSIGFRLLAGDLTLMIGLAVLIIIPEVYAPLREVGARFHDAQDGLSAADQILSFLAQAPVQPNLDQQHERASISKNGPTVRLSNLTVLGRDGAHPENLSALARPGTITVLWGPNGSGKSTVLLALLGIATEGVSGDISISDSDVELRGSALWQQSIYLPQRPVLDPSTVGDVSALSLGQRQRLAVTQELAREANLLLLDEPTAHLDSDNAAAMLATLRERADSGATVIIVSHDPLVRSVADEIVQVR